MRRWLKLPIALYCPAAIGRIALRRNIGFGGIALPVPAELMLEGIADRAEKFLAGAGFDRAPWLAVGFAGGVLAWFHLANPWQWLALLAICAAAVIASIGLLRSEGRWPFLRQAIAAMALFAAAGCAAVWSKSALVGTPAIARPMVVTITGTVLDRTEQPAEQRVRLLLATREPGGTRAIRVRLNLPAEADRSAIGIGAVLRLRARLMPPAPPMLPGGYDFARTAWFAGIAATGGVIGEVAVLGDGHGPSRHRCGAGKPLAPYPRTSRRLAGSDCLSARQW